MQHCKTTMNDKLDTDGSEHISNLKQHNYNLPFWLIKYLLCS